MRAACGSGGKWPHTAGCRWRRHMGTLAATQAMLGKPAPGGEMTKSRIPTTTIGAYPKPDYVPVRDWFNLPDGMSTSVATELYEKSMAEAGDMLLARHEDSQE